MHGKDTADTLYGYLTLQISISFDWLSQEGKLLQMLQCTKTLNFYINDQSTFFSHLY